MDLGFGLANPQKDRARAVRLLEKACDAGSPDGCVGAGVYYENGWGVRKDLGRAVALYQKACDGGSFMPGIERLENSHGV